MVTYKVLIYGPKDEEILLDFNPEYKREEVDVKDVGIVDFVCSWIRILTGKMVCKIEG